MSDNIDQRVLKIIAEQAVLDANDVSLYQSLDDLGIDSLGLVECIFAIEEEFEISVPFNANDPKQTNFDISSVATIASAVKRLILEQAGQCGG
ncbi:MAG: phosphopantetheine-binding protein [Litoreibacter sp.]